MLAYLSVPAQAQTTADVSEEAAYRAAAAALLDEVPFDGMHWGVLIREVEGHRTLLSLNEGRKFAPASNMKLLTTSGAVIALGMDYRYETPVLVRGVLDNGEVDGDVVVVGSGDPTWSSRFFADSVTGPLRALVDSVVGAGIGRVTGSLVIDASAWDSTTVRPSWMVGDLGESYGSTGGAFAVDEGALRLEVRSGDVGTAPKVSRLGMGSDLGRLDSEAVAVLVSDSTDELRIEYKPGAERFLLTGGILIHSVDTVEAAVRHPVEIAGEALLALLEERGIVVAEGLRVEWPSEGAEEAALATPEVAIEPIVEDGHDVLFVITSPPLSEIIQAILEPSQNWIADQLLKTLGAVRGEGGGWPEGRRVLKELLVAEIGADSLDIDIRDGSGLSAYNLVTPRVLDALLSYMWTIPGSAVYRNALPEPGEEGSTLESRLEGLEGRLYAKTGTITHATSLSGYVQADSGKWLSFVILSNGSGLESSRVRARIDELVRLTATVH